MIQPDDASQISQPLSKATLALVQCAIQVANARDALERAMRLNPDYAIRFHFDPSRMQGLIDAIRQEVSSK